MTRLHDLATTDRTALGLGAIGGLLLALWSASAAVRTLMEALNIAYDEEESRGFIRFYGAAGAVVILLMWFLLSSYAILIGAEINAAMERQTRKDTTAGGDKPMGARGHLPQTR
jgi:uncharacterized BrkB/YihY/UPF0761 family membrane protein